MPVVWPTHSNILEKKKTFLVFSTSDEGVVTISKLNFSGTLAGSHFHDTSMIGVKRLEDKKV